METGGLDLWKKVCLEKCTVSLEKMVAYCQQDVVVLEKVFEKLNPYSKPKTNYAVLKGGEKYECPECGKIIQSLSVDLSELKVTSLPLSVVHDNNRII